MREGQSPAVVAPGSFQTQQVLVALLTPELVGTLEAALGLPTGPIHWTTAVRFPRLAGGALVHPLLVSVKVVHLSGHGHGGRTIRQCGQNFFQLPDHFDRRFVLELSDQELESGFEFFLVLPQQHPARAGQVLPGVVEVQPLAGLGPRVGGQTPDSHRRVGDDQRAGRLPQAGPQRLGVQLFAQSSDSLGRGDRTALGDDVPPAGAVAALVKAEMRF